MDKKRLRVLSGMRPTGKLHIGHLHGALNNWIALQEDYECFYFAADWHALTSEYASTEGIRENTINMMIDWLACGIDPERSTLFIQSKMPEHAELYLILSMITPVPWLERCPTYKEMVAELKAKDLSTFGFLGYPVLQAADIIIYKAHRVPVGEDQIPHIELTREIARRFNHFYGPVFPLPEGMVTEVPRLLGMDGRKMSKSFDNAIYLSDDDQAIKKKVSMMITDPQRARRSDPGNPDVCNVFSLHKIYSPGSYVEEVNRECRRAGIGCVEDKAKLAEAISLALGPYREKRAYYLSHIKTFNEIVEMGRQKAGEVAVETIREVREAIKL